MRFYVLASSDWRPPTPEEREAGWRWTYEVGVSFAGPGSRVAVTASAPKENHAAVLTLAEASSELWAQHFRDADAEWLKPWLERLRTGPGWRSRRVRRQLLEAFLQRHGRRATSYAWNV